MDLRYRDTDRDWRRIGDEEPFWGVVTLPQFRRDALTPDGAEAFYALGEADIDWIAALVEQHGGAPLRARRALDFGCGVGRLTRAMTRYADHVTGLDISPGMLARAAERPHARITYVERLSGQTFDWLNSYVVFQHIPPPRGMAILKDLLDRLRPGGWVTLHFNVGRSDAHRAPTTLGRVRQWLHQRLKPTDGVSMFDYDLDRLVAAFEASGVHAPTLVRTDHGGCLGVMIVGRRDPAARPA